MAVKRLRSLRIEYDPSGVIDNVSDASVGITGDPSQRDLAWRLSGVIGRLKLVTIFFAYRLDAVRIEMRNPPATTVWLSLSRRPGASINFSRGTLSLDRLFEPTTLLNIPIEAASLGEFAIDCWEWACSTLETKTDFPAAFIREQIDVFRAQGYAQGSTLKTQSISGSRAKARIHGVVSCARTLLKVEVVHRGEVLFERVILDVPEQAFNVAFMPREISVENGMFKVHAASLGLLPQATFPLDTLPEAFLKSLD